MKCSLPYKEAANNSKSFLVDTGALEDMQSNRIKDIAIFRRVNRQLSKNAKDVYGVEGKLWLEDDGEEIALPNRPVLNAIDDKRKELGLYEDRIAGSIKKTTPKPIEKQVEKPIIQDTKGFKEEIENKGIKPGVSEFFESNPELASIGSTEQYSQYLDTIFPDSKVEEIDNSLYISDLEDLKSNKIIEKQCS